MRVELVSGQSASTGQELEISTGVVRVSEVYWTASEVELYPCSSALESVKIWLLPEAHAHGDSSPTRMAVPTVVDATAGEGVALGELSPPAGRYCSVRYRLAPADADAVGLSQAPDMLGRSLLLRGSYGPENGELAGFELASETAIDITRSVNLELTSDHRFARFVFGCSAERWLLGLNPSGFSEAGAETAILEAYRDSFDVVVE